eukprot:jgi/Ulvmu1/15/UM001_0016.1
MVAVIRFITAMLCAIYMVGMAWGPAPAGARAALSAAPLRRSMVGDDAGLDSSAASDAITVAETGQEGGGDTIMLEHGVVALEEGGAGRDEGEVPWVERRDRMRRLHRRRRRCNRPGRRRLPCCPTCQRVRGNEGRCRQRGTTIIRRCRIRTFAPAPTAGVYVGVKPAESPSNSAAAHDRPDGAESVDDMRTGYMLTYYDGEVVGADGEVVQYDDEIEYDDIEYNDIEYDGIKYDGAGLQ